MLFRVYRAASSPDLDDDDIVLVARALGTADGADVTARGGRDAWSTSSICRFTKIRISHDFSAIEVSLIESEIRREKCGITLSSRNIIEAELVICSGLVALFGWFV